MTQPALEPGKYLVCLYKTESLIFKDAVLQNSVVTREGLGILMIYMLGVNPEDVTMLVDRLDSPTYPNQMVWYSQNPNYPFEIIVTKTGMN